MANEIRVGGLLGTYFLEATTAHTGKKFSMLSINTDAVLSALVSTRIDNGNNSTTTYQTITTNELANQNLVGRTISKGQIICAPQGTYFSSITFASGDAIGIISEG